MKPVKYELVTLDEVRASLDASKPLAFDVETSGLYGTIELAQFYQSSWPAVLIVRRPEIFNLASLIKTQWVVCHFVSYEVSTIQQQLGAALGKVLVDWVPNHFDDTLLTSKLKYYWLESFSLDECYKECFGRDVYAMQGLTKKEMQKSDWSKQLSAEQLLYAATDVFYLLDLFDATTEDVVDELPYQLDIVATRHALSFQTNGLPVDKDLILKRINDLKSELNSLNIPINVNSYVQVRKYLDTVESSGLALATLALSGDQKAADVRRAKSLSKSISFLNKFLDTSVAGRIFGKFAFSTKSGRGNCRDQNLQQFPRSLKDVIKAPQGKVFVMSDYSQLELRYICAYSGESAMAKLYVEGADLHQHTADTMNVPRLRAKTCNFNLTYGGSANMLQTIFIEQAGLLVPIQEVRQMKKAWHNLWPTLTKWQTQVSNDHRKGLTPGTPIGRKFKAKLYTDAMNLPIQGGSAEIAKLALHRMITEVKANDDLKDRCEFVLFVHDSFTWICDDDPEVYTKLAEITARCMQHAWFELVEYTKIPGLPMPVEVQVGYNYGDVEYGKEKPIYEYSI